MKPQRKEATSRRFVGARFIAPYAMNHLWGNFDQAFTDTESKNNNDIQWHPAFVVALQALLIDYKDDLDYRLEHPLTTGSLSIDMLVISPVSPSCPWRR